jgi:pimeloyl-ACP methyl ester carboxylesterase
MNLSGQIARMTITRHFAEVDGRFVHYRKAGRGPPLLMVHQSPRSSAEYTPLMERWSEAFTCIAPDTPGFGQSDPLPGDPDINAFADALIGFMDSVGLERVPAYGFHSGGIILVTALKRHPHRFSALAVGGYAVWTQAERAAFSAAYLPPLVPSAYGEHLIWLWNRILEQSWFFPWFDVRPETRLPAAHDDPERVHATIIDMLYAGDAYRAGYGAVLRAPRDIPPADFDGPPVLITAYDGDPLQAHLDRLGALPPNWTAHPVATPRQHQDESFAVLQAHAASHCPPLRDSRRRGFTPLATDDWQGLIHWRGEGEHATVAGPGRSAALLEGLAVDPPGHGLSDPWPNLPELWAPWDAVLGKFARDRELHELCHRPLPPGDPDRLFPDLSPDRHGAYLTRAWNIVRAAHLFAPWYEASAATARAFSPADLAPERLAAEHLALLQASAAKPYMQARQQGAI